jgi:hypothetical protein
MVFVTMGAPLKLAAFAAVLAAVFGLATFVGASIGPDRESEAAVGAAQRGSMAAEAHGGEAEARGGEAADAHSGAADPVRGLAVADDGLTLSLAATTFQRGRSAELRFRILDSSRTPVRDFDVEHEKRMHLIVVRRDGSGFQHLHPELRGDATWSVPLMLPEAGAYRVFADFSYDGEARTLATDLTVDGEADYRDLPAPESTATTSDGYDVGLDAHAVSAGEAAELAFTVERGGERVTPEPYLGARGHLVALREGDLAFLHVHPDDDSLAFTAEFPTAVRYRLYLQFKHDGRVHTAAFTREVER